MKKDMLEQIEIPKGVSVSVSGDEILIKGDEGEVKKKLKTWKVRLSVKDNKIILEQKKATKNEKKIINTLKAHLKNMIKGVQKKFEYRLKICFVHFPFTLKQEENKILIKNFLGEKVDRVAELPGGVDVEIKKDFITIRSPDKELAGQASARLESATKIRKRDKRVFQDGIYIIEKDGKKI